MFLARIILAGLFLSGVALAQSNPGFVDGKPLCANYPNSTQCPAPANPLSLNQAFIAKQDYPAPIISGVTPCNGCATNSVLAGIAGVVGGDIGFKYAGNGGQLQLNQFGILTSPAPATWQLGALDSAAPLAQTLRFQSGATLDTAGQNATIIGSLSSGSGNSGDLIFQVGIKSGVSGMLATPTTALTIQGETGAISTLGSIQAPGISAGSGRQMVAGNAAQAYSGILIETSTASWFIDNRGTIDMPNNRLAFSAGGSDLFAILATGSIMAPSLPTSAGSGGIYVCVDNVGVLYKKASCP